MGSCYVMQWCLTHMYHHLGGTWQHVLQIQAVYCLKGYVTETATQLLCLKLATHAKHHISNIWTTFFNITYTTLQTKEMPVKTA